jgi:hypothetical protein
MHPNRRGGAGERHADTRTVGDLGEPRDDDGPAGHLRDRDSRPLADTAGARGSVEVIPPCIGTTAVLAGGRARWAALVRQA